MTDFDAIRAKLKDIDDRHQRHLAQCSRRGHILCDFCSRLTTQATSLPCDDHVRTWFMDGKGTMVIVVFDAGVEAPCPPGFQSVFVEPITGPWLTCADCLPLVEREDRAALIRRFAGPLVPDAVAGSHAGYFAYRRSPN